MDILKTGGSEFFTLNGKEYVGEYYLDNNIAYIYFPESKIREKLIPRFMHNTELIRSRSKHRGGYTAPNPYIPAPTSIDYARGIIDRFFMQKRTFPKNTVMEVSKEDFSRYAPSDNYNRINSNVYNATTLKWAIAGNPEYIVHHNKMQIEKVVRQFPGLDWYLINLKEFYREHSDMHS